MAGESADCSHGSTEGAADEPPDILLMRLSKAQLIANNDVKIADPAPLGLFAFALTTFVVSAYNAGALGVAATDPINAVVPLGVFYGGVAQAVAGMWSFVRGDTFSATAFTSYGAFWIAYPSLFIPAFGVSQAYVAVGGDVLVRAKAIFLLGWTIFTFIMLLASTRTSVALCTLFGLVASTFTLLTAAEFSENVGLHRAGGFVGLITAALAWYNALAELLLAQPYSVFTLPLGKYVPSSASLPRRAVFPRSPPVASGSGKDVTLNRSSCNGCQMALYINDLPV